jgi:hypothetical protein
MSPIPVQKHCLRLRTPVKNRVKLRFLAERLTEEKLPLIVGISHACAQMLQRCTDFSRCVHVAEKLCKIIFKQATSDAGF